MGDQNGVPGSCLKSFPDMAVDSIWERPMDDLSSSHSLFFSLLLHFPSLSLSSYISNKLYRYMFQYINNTTKWLYIVNITLNFCECCDQCIELERKIRQLSMCINRENIVLCRWPKFYLETPREDFQSWLSCNCKPDPKDGRDTNNRDNQEQINI